MAGKFVDLKEAAKMLGVTPEELVEMRSHGDIFGYRDGASWKFKIEEVERVMADKGSKSGTGSGVGSGVLENDEDFDEIIKTGLSSKKLTGDKASDSVLVTEQELGHSAEGTSSTIIGKGEKAAGPADSDLKLAEGLSSAGGSDKLLEAPGSRLKAPDKADVLGGDLKIAGGSGTGDMPVKTGSGTGDMPVKTGSGTGDMPKVKGGSALDTGDELDLESSEELDLGEEMQVSESGKKKGSDVTLGAGDSGINLKPSDSGLNLEEEPLDLGGSAVESLELPEDEEVISLSEEAVDQDEATQLKADDQFMLSPSEALQEDESDSGSQVIALEDSAAFDENAATLLKQEQPAMLGEEAFGAAVAMPAEPLAAATMAPAYGAAPVYVPPVEAPYSVWNVLGLMLTAGVLTLCGMLMVDVVMNMWSWNGASAPISSGIMDAFMGMFNLR
jgi:hypothetical protein